MLRTRRLRIPGPMILGLSLAVPTAGTPAQEAPAAPHLKKQGTATQLIDIQGSETS